MAQVRAQLESAKWDLSQTTVIAPANGYAINLQLRPGSMTAAFPALPVLTFVEDEFQVVALYDQNELHAGRAGQRGGDRAEDVPGPHHQGEGRFHHLGAGPGPVRGQHQPADDRRRARPPEPLPGEARSSSRATRTSSSPPARVGHAAIYTEHAEAIHILRMVILRIGAITDYLILKLH